jgi:hypothetical protein
VFFVIRKTSIVPPIYRHGFGDNVGISMKVTHGVENNSKNYCNLNFYGFLGS